MVIKINPHKWQQESTDMWIDNNYSGIDLCGTGTGKSISAILKILKMRKNTLIVVPTEVLLRQWYKEIKKFVDIPEEKIGLYYGKEKRIGNITIAIVNSVMKSDYKFDEFFKFVVIDEIHNINENKFDGFLLGSKFKYKYGLTATIERDDNFHETVINYMGGINYILPESEAKEEGYINRFTFVDVGITLPQEEMDINDEFEKKIKKYRDEMVELTGDKRINPFDSSYCDNPTVKLYKSHYRRTFAKLKDFLFNHYMKNRIAIKLIQDNSDKKIICFNEFEKNATLIDDVLNGSGTNSVIVKSKSKKKTELALEKFSTDDCNVLVAVRVLDEGYNLPTIDMGLLIAGSGKEKQIKQRVGRVIRKKENASIIYQLFIKGTRDEKFAEKRREFIDYADQYITLNF